MFLECMEMLEGGVRVLLMIVLQGCSKRLQIAVFSVACCQVASKQCVAMVVSLFSSRILQNIL